jgi:hypothetical protein
MKRTEEKAGAASVHSTGDGLLLMNCLRPKGTPTTILEVGGWMTDIALNAPTDLCYAPTSSSFNDSSTAVTTAAIRRRARLTSPPQATRERRQRIETPN